MKNVKRSLSMFVSLCVSAGIVSTNAQAAGNINESTQLKAVEVKGASRLDDLKAEPNELQVETIYGDEDIVTAIVEMEESPVVNYYDITTYSDSARNMSAGESVSEFLTSEEAKEISEDLIKDQDKIISKISKLVNKSELVAKASNEFEVVDNWTTITNAILVKVPYGLLKEIREIKGVKSAYVEHTYSRPEPIENSVVQEGKGNFSYSYDMVGINETWNAGYTGKEMLVAVLDTGLDIKMSNEGEIVRVHEAFTDESFKSGNPLDEENGWNLRYTDESLEEFLKENQLKSTTGANGNHITYDYNALYKNLKVPYACDYADGDLHVLPSGNDHGTHVSGTVAGYAETDEGEVKFSGVSPDAQILAMKVFPDTDGGAQEGVLINALEDSLTLGADIINLSLGSDNGFADDDTVINGIYDRVSNAGIVLMTSAGNADKSSDENNYNGHSLASNPDESMISSPAVYNSNLSVASIDNTIDVQSYLTWNDAEGIEHIVPFQDSTGLIKSDFSDKEYPVYAVGGVGNYEDYYNAGFDNGYNNGKTGIALVKRGEISFADKINNALSFAGKNSNNEDYGVLAVLIYDNNPEGTELVTMSVAGTTISSAFISGKDGEEIVKAIESGYEVKIKSSKTDRTVDNATAGEMSSFTSWGAGTALELKPEITAPGGNIWSTVLDYSNEGEYTGEYGMMSGTSMAAPHMSGIGALVRQYVSKEDAFASLSSSEVGQVVSQLLMSTAIPQKDNNGVYYSPRQQGAGLVNAYAAISTPAYITVDGKNVGKLELGDDPNKKGEYNIDFNLNNISNENLEYDVQVVLMRTNTETVDSKWGQRQVNSNNDLIIKTISLGNVSVSAKNSTSFHKTVSLTDAEKAELDNLFENGTYIEGYVILTDAKNGENPQLGLPLLAYYGDWTKAPIFDSATWIDEAEDGENVFNNETTFSTNIVGSTIINDIYGVVGFYNLGQNMYDPTSKDTQLIYEKENITLSPNGDGFLDYIDDYILYQLRDAKLIVVEAKDAETGEVYMRDWTSYSLKSLYNASYGVVMPYSVYGLVPTWNGTDKDGNILPSGTKCIYTITAYGDGEYGDKVYNDEAGREVTNFDDIIPGEKEPTFNGHKMDKEGDVISFPVTIDTVAPKLKNNAVSFYEENGRTYITGTVYDEDGSIAFIEVAPYVKRTYKEGYGDPNYSEFGIDRSNTFYTNYIYDPATKEYTFTVDVTEYAHTIESYPGENNYYDYEWTGNVLVSCGDYGANDRSYAIKVDSSRGIILSQTSALLNPGDEFELSVNNNTDDLNNTITRTSSNPEVATIDQYGHVKAIAPGQTTITVSNGISSAVCIVAVEEENTEVIDFDLSIDSFSGLKPDGQLVVKVNNLQPANVKIDNIRWEFYEDEDFANNYASGLVSVGKYSSDALEGFVYLTINSSEDVIPAGSGVLKVTVGNVEKTMEIDWNEIYKTRNQDDIISAANYNDQAIYVTQGETATLLAKYRQNSLHQVGEVYTELKGLKLDGADFFNIGGQYTARLVNEEGYSLPSEVQLYTLYSDGYKYPINNYPSYNAYSYDSSTGEIVINYAPTGADNDLLIVADGVECEGAIAGTMSGKTYTRPDDLFGPFDWTLTSGNGDLIIGETEVSGKKVETAMYTPSEPGVSYITATTKDGKYSVNFAVVSEAVLAEKITLDTNKVEIKVGETFTPKATLSPTPTLAKDEALTWTSFNPEVATVDEDGTITAVSEGYAYIKVASTTDCRVQSYCIVKVNKGVEEYTVTFVADGQELKSITKKNGDVLSDDEYPEIPVKEGYTASWPKVTEPITGDLIIEAIYTSIPDEPENPESPDDSEGDKPGTGNSNAGTSGTGKPNNNSGSANSNIGSNNSTVNNNANANNNISNKIPQTGGNNWVGTILISVLLCLTGALTLLVDRKKLK